MKRVCLSLIAAFCLSSLSSCIASKKQLISVAQSVNPFENLAPAIYRGQNWGVAYVRVCEQEIQVRTNNAPKTDPKYSSECVILENFRYNDYRPFGLEGREYYRVAPFGTKGNTFIISAGAPDDDEFQYLLLALDSSKMTISHDDTATNHFVSSFDEVSTAMLESIAHNNLYADSYGQPVAVPHWEAAHWLSLQ